MNPYVQLGLLSVLAGCFGTGAPLAHSPGLGIEAFRTIDTAERTTIVGLDDQGRPIARLELIHGRFRPTVDFGPEYRGRDVDGRKLTVDVNGQTFEWQTLGFSDTLRMPPLPSSLNAVAAFLGDGRVRPILEKWRIGWASEAAPQVVATRGETENSCYPGTNPVFCNGESGGQLLCPISNGLNTKACNGLRALDARVVSQDQATFGWDQDTVSMLCSEPVFGLAVAVKTCAVAPSLGTDTCPAGHYCSSCGDSGTTTRCAACFTASNLFSARLFFEDAGYNNVSGWPVVSSCYSYCPAHTPPSITVLGSNPLTTECHSGVYADPGATARDVCDGDLTASIATISSVVPNTVGAYSVDYSVTNASALVGSASRTVLVRDTTAPIITLKPPIEIWPPDQKMRAFTLADCASAADACAGTIDVNAAGAITSISSSERGSGDFTITGRSSFALRADRDGKGSGRVYEIKFTVSDPSGNAAVGICRVQVPHER